MKKLLDPRLLFLPLLLLPFLGAGETQRVEFTGSIGPYPVELELWRRSSVENNTAGRYRYAGKKEYLDLQGWTYPGGLFQLEESWKGKVSGSFFLKSENGELSGYWVGNNNNSYSVTLKTEADALTALEPERKAPLIDGRIIGIYRRSEYFLNDLHYRPDSPQVEIGVNGGTVIVTENEEGSIHIALETISGPTYHIADFQGDVEKKGENVFESNKKILDSDDPCHLTFTFSPGRLTVEQHSSSMACGFGARAYAGGVFIKEK